MRHIGTRGRIVEADWDKGEIIVEAHWENRGNCWGNLGQEGELLRHTGTREIIVEAHWDKRGYC